MHIYNMCTIHIIVCFNNIINTLYAHYIHATMHVYKYKYVYILYVVKHIYYIHIHIYIYNIYACRHRDI